MNICYIIPTGQYSFFEQLIEPLISAGINVSINTIQFDTDLILAAILPITHDWIPRLQETTLPFILWHWDLYSFVDLTQWRWAEFLKLLPRATEIWSCSYEVARQLKERLGLDSRMVPAWVDEDELAALDTTQTLYTITMHGPIHTRAHTQPYALYAASSCAFGKRVDWAERACSMLNYPFKLLKGQSLPRAEYLKSLAGCRVYLMTAFEESNGTIPATEAMALGKPVVCADLPSSREVFGESAYYFRNDSFESLLTNLKQAWLTATIHSSTGSNPFLSQRILSLFGLKPVSKRIITALKEVHHASQQARTR